MAFDTSGIRLKPCVDLFSTEASRQDAGLEKIREIPLDQLVPFKDHPVKTTGEAGGLIRPCKGLLPASANRALKIWQSHLYYRQPPSSGGSFTFFSFN